MKREDILALATLYITNDRNNEYGEPEDNFARIAEYWTTYLSNGDRRFNISAYDVGLMMTLFKLARIEAAPLNKDSYVDAAGYIACAAEVAGKGL